MCNVKYTFSEDGSVAYGHLPDGIVFMVDTSSFRAFGVYNRIRLLITPTRGMYVMTKVHKGGNHHEGQLQHPKGRAQGDG